MVLTMDRIGVTGLHFKNQNDENLKRIRARGLELQSPNIAAVVHIPEEATRLFLCGCNFRWGAGYSSSEKT